MASDADVRGFRVRLFIALAALMAVVVFYLGLVTLLFVDVGLLLWRGAPHGNWILIVLALVPGLLGVMLAQPIFRVEHEPPAGALELTADNEPEVVALVHAVADAVGAPHPHRILLTPEVNAAVTFDVRLSELIFPSRKSLLIGVGLINVLTMDELKAVLAHEFGHFRQGSMRVNTWLYLAREVGGDFVQSRTVFDGWIRALSRSDPRVAWVGWGLGLWVWSVRTTLDRLFGVAIRASHALGREMEFDADRVAVSVAGSDSLVHALAKLSAADEALQIAFSEAAVVADKGVRPGDLPGIQTWALARLRQVYHEPDLGVSPRRPEPPDPSWRVFKRAIAVIPRMYASHPPSHEREERARTPYVPSALDDRSPWSLFRHELAVRRAVTDQTLGLPDRMAGKDPAPLDAVCELVGERLDRIGYNPLHRGMYLGRPAMRHLKPGEDPAGQVGPGPLQVAEVMTEEVGELLRRRRELNQELGTLRALSAGHLEIPGTDVELRGRRWSRRELPTLIEEVVSDVAEVDRALHGHDRALRAAAVRAARALGPEHERALRDLYATLHYTEHTFAVLDDAENIALATLQHVTRDGNLAWWEENQLVTAMTVAWDALSAVFAQIDAVKMPARVVAEVPDFKDWNGTMFGGYAGPQPAREHLRTDWTQNFFGLIRETVVRMGVARAATLDVMLKFEAELGRRAAAGETFPLDELGGLGRVPAQYDTMAPGDERAKAIPPRLLDRIKLGIGPFWGTVQTLVAVGVLVSGVSMLMFLAVETWRMGSPESG